VKNPALFAKANGGRPAIAATPKPAAFNAPGVVGAHGAAPLPAKPAGGPAPGGPQNTNHPPLNANAAPANAAARAVPPGQPAAQHAQVPGGARPTAPPPAKAPPPKAQKPKPEPKKHDEGGKK